MDRQDKGSKKVDSLAEEEAKLLESLGLLHLVQESENDVSADCRNGSIKTEVHDDDSTTTILPSSTTSNKILLGIGGTLFLLPHLAVILSLPPVLQRRGAPYLPTFATKLNVMFDLIKYTIYTITIFQYF